MFSRPAKIGLSFVLGLTFLFSPVMPVYPLTELEQKQKELEEIQQAIDKFEKLATQKQNEERKVLGEIKNLENNMDLLEKDITVLADRITETTAQIALAQQDIDHTSKRVDECTTYLNARLKQLYLDGKVNYLEVLLKSSSLTDFLTRFDLLTKVAENDARILRELQAEKQGLLIKKVNLEEKMESFHNLKDRRKTNRNRWKFSPDKRAFS